MTDRQEQRRAPDEPALIFQLPEDQPCFDGFAEPNLVRKNRRTLSVDIARASASIWWGGRHGPLKGRHERIARHRIGNAGASAHERQLVAHNIEGPLATVDELRV